MDVDVRCRAQDFVVSITPWHSVLSASWKVRARLCTLALFGSTAICTEPRLIRMVFTTPQPWQQSFDFDESPIFNMSTGAKHPANSGYSNDRNGEHSVSYRILLF
jgi:hypothetical protein